MKISILILPANWGYHKPWPKGRSGRQTQAPRAERTRDDTDTDTVLPAFKEAKRDKPYLIVLAGSAMGVMHHLERRSP